MILTHRNIKFKGLTYQAGEYHAWCEDGSIASTSNTPILRNKDGKPISYIGFQMIKPKTVDLVTDDKKLLEIKAC